MRKVETKISSYKLNPSTRADQNTFLQALQHVLLVLCYILCSYINTTKILLIDKKAGQNCYTKIIQNDFQKTDYVYISQKQRHTKGFCKCFDLRMSTFWQFPRESSTVKFTFYAMRFQFVFNYLLMYRSSRLLLEISHNSGESTYVGVTF